VSINSLANIAVTRDKTELPAQSFGNALVSAIPTEVLSIYTFVLTGIVGTTDLVGHEELLARWLLYVAGFIAIAVTLVVTYGRRRNRAKARRFPVAELLAAMIGFAAWGLVMPGSPLMAVLSQRHAQMWTAIIIGAGALFLFWTTGRLTVPAKGK
jgi:hypothetical protein